MTSTTVEILKYIRENGPMEARPLAEELDIHGVYAVHIDRCVASKDWFAYDDKDRIHLTDIAPGSGSRGGGD